ncbi:MAG: Sialic acid TRAP transporter permease protein SiaT [Verrucomicrobia bacterium ADurb.Bin474]|nr:MAG: Sialic acid TRAP transporter permease protein SiaT [Verrucomicrobia bacterium ADurb.Bin474]
MEIEVLLLVVSFFALLVLNVPIAVAIGLATFFTVLSLGNVPTSYVVAQRMSSGIASFPLLAIPFFVFSGVLMGEGGMARRLMAFANALMGGFKGGLAYVNTLTCMLFGAVSGSAGAAVSSIGGFMIPEMERNGYSKPFSVALTTTSATTGLLIPPSNIMILYAVVAGNVSVAGLFMAGVLPGAVVGLLIMLASRLTVKGAAPARQKGALKMGDLFRAFGSAILSLFLIVIVLGGILSGVFTATEASAIAVAYALLLGVVVYREIKWSALPSLILRSAKTTAIVMFLVGASQAMSWVLAYENVPQMVSSGLLSLTENPIITLLIINCLLLVVGTFMDMTPAVLIFTPIFLPVVMSMGIDPVHFGIVMIANLCIGLCTPPVGTCLFIGCSVGGVPLSKVIRPMIPMFVAMVIGLLLITYIPSISLWLPRLLRL